MQPHRWRLLMLACVAVILTSCSQKRNQSNASESERLKPASAHGAIGEPATLPETGLQFTAPPGWISENPSSSIRQAQYRLPRFGGDSEDAELAVFYFKGVGGAVQANIDRWIGQFVKADGSPAADVAKTTHKIVHGILLTIVDISGTYSGTVGSTQQGGSPKSNFRMLAAVAEAANGPWFIKLTGPAKTVSHWESSVESFLESIR